jgi:hypothetical protein
VQHPTRRNLLALAVAVLVLLPFVLRAAELVLCGSSCVCITWISGASAYIEVRCPTEGGSGWTSGSGGTPDGSSGSWGGSGNPASPPTPLPGNVLDPTTLNAVNGAKQSAISKVRGERVSDPGTPKGTWLPTKCTDLFLNSPLGYTGAYLLGNYLVYRDGTGVKDTAGVDQCALGRAAWTTCCQHDPIVYICSTQFTRLSPDDRAKILIHEAMHVGGQQEDKNGSVGPGDPPNTGQISDAVNNACN